VLLGGVVGDSVVRAVYPAGPPGGATRIVDDTPLLAAGNLATAVVPLVILLGVVAGIGVVLRFLRATGVERLQLRWRAVGVLGALILFPFAVTETVPDAVSDMEPLLFVATLAVPVLRYDLWAIDSIVRRSAVHAFGSPATVLENLLRATAEMLRLPYVAVRRGDRVLASYGVPTGRVETWPLRQDGEPLGDMEVAPRHGLESVTEEDRRIIATLAQMVSGTVRAEALTHDLVDARHRMVTAHEEERRRLRRDLHDGLGPLLTGLGLNLDAAITRLGRTDEQTATYLRNARSASTEVITSLRELVEGLRPPALDELGLDGALKLQLERLAHDAGLALDLRIPEQMRLSAAVEVATFRTAVEAVTNVARHSRAQRVDVEIVRNGLDLAVTVTDDGPSRATWTAGTGLTGMRERAEELGGSLTAGPTAEGGLVRATYPLGVEA
jgi:signal transduction histidine kinase